MKKNNIINLGLLATLVVSTAYLLFMVTTTDDALEIRHYIGIVATCVSAISFLFNKNLFKYCLGLTLVIGNFCGLSTFPTILTSALWFHPGSIQVPLYWGQPQYSAMLFIYLIVNREFYTGRFAKENLKNLLVEPDDEKVVTSWPGILDSSIEKESQQSIPNKPISLSLGKVQEFKEKYANMNLDELIELSNDKRFIPEAKQAALELIEERKIVGTD
jgi:hypothetical protein